MGQLEWQKVLMIGRHIPGRLQDSIKGLCEGRRSTCRHWCWWRPGCVGTLGCFERGLGSGSDGAELYRYKLPNCSYKLPVRIVAISSHWLN